MVQTISYDMYILDSAIEVIYSNLKELKEFISEENYLSLVDMANFLKDMVFNNLNLEVMDYDIKSFLPEIKPIIEYSFLYELESLLEDINGSSGILDNDIENINICFFNIMSTLDAWYEHLYGYTFEELEDDMFRNKFGVFGVRCDE